MKIKLNTIQEVQDFVKIANTEFPHKLYATQDNYVVDAKSIMGLFSLDLLRDVELKSESKIDENLFKNFSIEE